MPVSESKQQPSPASGYSARMWLGCDGIALLKLLARNRFRIGPAQIPIALADTLAGLLHTGGRWVQRLLLGRKLDRVRLADDPIFILGHWRTGTTLLHELLALDPAHQYPTTYQCMSPNHFLVSQWWLAPCFRFLLPRRRPMDNMAVGWKRPQEDEFALCNMGVPSPYLTIAFPNHGPQYQEYFDLEGLSPQELELWKRGLVRFLKQLTYHKPSRLVLKSPPHTFRLRILSEMFPRARFIYLVRNPFEVFSSTVHLWKSLYTAHGYQRPKFAGLEEHVLKTFARMHQRWEADREQIDPARICQVRYEDLVADTEGQLRRVYDELNLGSFSRVAQPVANYLADNRDYQPNRYQISNEQRQEVANRWRPYFEAHGYRDIDTAVAVS